MLHKRLQQITDGGFGRTRTYIRLRRISIYVKGGYSTAWISIQTSLGSRMMDKSQLSSPGYYLGLLEKEPETRAVVDCWQSSSPNFVGRASLTDHGAGVEVQLHILG